ncbi:MAG TPA: glycosyltransferase family 4 protein [Paludibacter sp.]|nr:glycosyltransferase family 4 protein [Paludibacter sp.]
MKIAYLLGSLNRGGTETLLLDVFRNAEQNDLDAMGIYRKQGSLESDFRQSGVEMVQLPVEKNLLAYLIRLRRLLVRNKISIVHAQQPLDALFAWLACLGTGLKIILTFHGYDFNDKKKGVSILKFIIKRTDANIFVSETQRQYYQQQYSLKSEKQTVVYNGISFDKLNMFTHQITSSHPMSNLRNELHISPDALLIGSVGNFVPVRDQLSLCRFLKLLNEQEVDFHFIFVGKRAENTPDSYDDCYNFCQENHLLNKVSFLGSRNDVPAILQQLDAFLYATAHDTFGIAVVEAMAMGIPVFVNDWEVMAEITDKGKYATLYKTKDEVDLLQQFMLFLQDKTPYKIKALEAARFVCEMYSIEKHIENLKQVYSR